MTLYSTKPAALAARTGSGNSIFWLSDQTSDSNPTAHAIQDISRDEIALLGFDYAGLAAADIATVRGAEAAIRQHGRKHIEEAIAIGRELIRVKDVLAHGQFGKWIMASFSFSERTATNYMRAAEVYRDKPETASDLQLPPALLYRAASSDISDSARAGLFAPDDDGSRPTEQLIGLRLRHVISDIKERKRAESDAGRDTGQRRAREKRRREKERQEREEQQGKEVQREQLRNAATKSFANLLAEKLSDDDLDELTRLWADAEAYHILAMLENIRRGAQR